MTASLTIFALLFAALIVWIVDANIGERDGGWYAYHGWFSTHARMRRLVNGTWQYREMTDDEDAQA